MTAATGRQGAAERSWRDDAKLAALEQRVYGLERGVQDLNQLFTGRIGEVSAQLAGLTSKLDERSRTPWATIVSAMGVVLAIVVAGGQLAKQPIDDAVARLERDVDRLSRDAAPAAGLSEFRSAYGTDRLLGRQDADARFARVDAALAALERRGRESEGAAVAALQRQLDDLKASAGGKDAGADRRDRLERGCAGVRG